MPSRPFRMLARRSAAWTRYRVQRGGWSVSENCTAEGRPSRPFDTGCLAGWLRAEPTEKKKQKKNGISKYFGLTLTRVTLRPDPSGQVVA